MPPKRTPSRPSKRQGSAAIFLIGAFKLVKGIALLLVGLGLLRMLHRDVAQTVNHWVQVLRVDPENHYLHKAIARIVNVSPKQLRELSVGTFVYSAILLTEGIGLLARKHWAEYFTVISTGIFIPLELYELFEHGTPMKFAVLLVNLLIVVYLIMRLKRA